MRIQAFILYQHYTQYPKICMFLTSTAYVYSWEPDSACMHSKPSSSCTFSNWHIPGKHINRTYSGGECWNGYLDSINSAQWRTLSIQVYQVSICMRTYNVFGLLTDNSIGMLSPCDWVVVSSWFPHHGQSRLDKYNDFNISLALWWRYCCNETTYGDLNL